MSLRVGSLCSGYEGIGLGLAEAGIDHELVFVADPDSAATAVLAHHYPGVPNLGDITAVDWATVPPVGLLTMGFPCTDVSLAGRGLGIAAGTRSGLWLECARAIDALRPPLVLIENVRGLLSARADSDVEPCPWCLGDRGGPDQEPVLRALGAVLGDLSDLRYDAQWVTVAAGRKDGIFADHVGACHERERVFILAWPQGQRPVLAAGGTCRVGAGADPVLVRDVAELLPTPRASANENRQTVRSPSQEAGTHRRSLAAEVCTLFPTPTAARYGSNQSPSPGAAVRYGLDAIDKLLPTPTAVHHARNATANRRAPKPTTCTTSWTLADVAFADRWGDYGPAVARWEAVLGRPAPVPVEFGGEGKARLSARFSEWMMGLPDGWVCDVPGLSRNDMLRLLGNGVVRQQLAHAIRLLAGGAR